jgi:hypothetical protein
MISIRTSLLLAIPVIFGSADGQEQTVKAIAETGIRIGDLRGEAEAKLLAAGVERTKHDQTLGYVPRKSLSDPLPPSELLYRLNDRLRLALYADRESMKIVEMVVRIQPAILPSRTALTQYEVYQYLECKGVNFNPDGSFSLHFPHMATDESAQEGK